MSMYFPTHSHCIYNYMYFRYVYHIYISAISLRAWSKIWECYSQENVFSICHCHSNFVKPQTCTQPLSLSRSLSEFWPCKIPKKSYDHQLDKLNCINKLCASWKSVYSVPASQLLSLHAFILELWKLSKIATSWDNWDAIFIMKNCEFHQFRDGRWCHDARSSHHVPLMFVAFQGTPLTSNASTSTSKTASDDTGTSAAVIGSTFSMSLFQIQNDLMARHANKNNETTFAETRSVNGFLMEASKASQTPL